MKAALRGRFFIEAMTINKERKKAASGQNRSSAHIETMSVFGLEADITR